MTVVVVDDTEDIRDLLRLTLEIDGRFRVVADAADGRAAIEAVKAHQPDAVILDLHMPVMSGDRALPIIRDVSPCTVVLVYSAYFSGSTDELMAAGAAAVVTKTAKPAMLADLLAHLVTERRREAEAS